MAIVTLDEQTKEYLNDKRWKEITELCKLSKFDKAAKLSNEIIDSYPSYVRSNAFNVY